MSLPTFQGATDELLGLFWDFWRAETPAANGGNVPTVQWPDDESDPPAADAPFARIRIRHNPSGQSTFGPTGQRRFARSGIVTVQVFTPVTDGAGSTLAGKLATIARNAYEGRSTASGIWFRDTRIKEVGSDKTWYQINVTVEFEYDEQR